MAVDENSDEAARDRGIRVTVAFVAWIVQLLSLAVLSEGDSGLFVKAMFVFAVPLLLYVAFVQTPEGTRRGGALLLLVLPVMYVVISVATESPVLGLLYVAFAQPVLWVAAPLVIVADHRVRRARSRPAWGPNPAATGPGGVAHEQRRPNPRTM